mgnify:CR=1 FL=1
MIEVIRTFFEKRWVRMGSLVAAAVAVGFIYILAHAVGYVRARGEGRVYVPVTPIGSNTIHYILPRFREAFDGYWWVSDTDLYEQRFAPALWPRLTPLLMLPLYVLFRGPWNVFWGDAILAAANFLLVFSILYLLLRRWFVSMLLATTFLFSRQLPLLLVPFGLDGSLLPSLDTFKILVKIFLPLHIGALYSQRFDFLLEESYKPGFLVLGPFLLLLFLSVRATDRKQKTIMAITAGILAGLLIYTYSFFWIFANVVIGLLALWALLRRDWRDGLRWVSAIGVGFLITAEYWRNYAALRALPYSSELFWRMTAAEHGRVIITSLWPWYAVYVIFAILVLRWGERHQRSAEARVLAAMLIAGVVLFNIQIVTGVTLAGEHWHTRVMVIPLMLAFSVSVLWAADAVRARWPRTRPWLAAGAALLFISQYIGAAHLQVLRVENQRIQHILPSGISESLLWMNKNLPRDSVILTPSFFTNTLIPYYTSARIFVPRGDMSIVPTEEILERFFIVARLMNLSVAKVAEMFGGVPCNNPVALGGNERLDCEVAIWDYQVEGHLFAGLMHPGKLSASLRSEQLVFSSLGRQKIAKSYEQMLAMNDVEIARLMSRYQADYVYVGPTERALGAKNLSAYSFLEPVYDSRGVTIYQIRRE